MKIRIRTLAPAVASRRTAQVSLHTRGGAIWWQLARQASPGVLLAAILAVGYAAFPHGLPGARIQLGIEAAMALADADAGGDSLGIRILGDPSFTKQVARSLFLLRVLAPEDFAFVRDRIKTIEEAPRSGIYVGSGVFHMSRRSAAYSLTWCAGSVCHDAYHVYMDQQRLLHQARARPVSRLTDLKQEEAKCRDYQYMVLKRIGASRYELTYLKAQNGDYLDLNGDGEFDWNDYSLRDW